MPSSKTYPVTVRLDTRAIKELQKIIPPEITISVVLRALIRAYLDDLVPDANHLIYSEAARSDAAIKQSQHALLHKVRRTKI